MMKRNQKEQNKGIRIKTNFKDKNIDFIVFQKPSDPWFKEKKNLQNLFTRI